jgi:hypothetical protein
VSNIYDHDYWTEITELRESIPGWVGMMKVLKQPHHVVPVSDLRATLTAMAESGRDYEPWSIITRNVVTNVRTIDGPLHTYGFGFVDETDAVHVRMLAL